MIAFPGWAFWAFHLVFLAFVAVILWMSYRGELVGSMQCTWSGQFIEAPAKINLAVRRQGAAKTGDPTVQVVLSTFGMIHDFPFTPYEAGVFADILDDAAHRVDPR